MSRTFDIRPYIGNENLSIDGRMIPYPLVSAEEYLMAYHEDMTDQDMDEFVENHYGQYSMLNAIIAMKQSIVLLNHTEHSKAIIAQSLRRHKDRVIETYNKQYPDEPFMEAFYDHYVEHLSVVHERLSDIDISSVEVPMCVVYEHPLDFPDKYVVRIMDVHSGDVQITNAIILRDTVEQCRKEIQNNGFLYYFPPAVEDDRHIVETWMR